jgi:hypothetical protein
MPIKMSKNAALGLIVAGAALILIAVLEHFLVKVQLLPHLGIYLIVLALILAGVGGYALYSQNNQAGPNPSGPNP